MQSVNDHFDVIIIGSGAGGGTLAHRLSNSGKKVLILERGTFLPREKENWSATEVFSQKRYYNTEPWYDKDGLEMNPAAGYWVGGNTKFYGGTLFRMREEEFNTVIHKGGTSPEWCVKYDEFAPYYSQAEALYSVHGQRGLDPTEPKTLEDYPYPAISHEPRIEAIQESLRSVGLRPFYLPLAIKLNEAQRWLSDCIRCETCDGHPCLIHAKADAEVAAVRPALEHRNVILMTQTKVTRLLTSTSGREISQVEAETKGEKRLFKANIVVIAGGAANSAALLLRSANDQHPNGLANRSEQVGRNYMKHNCGAVVAVMQSENASVFQKTLGVNDFYWGEPGFPYPMGQIQLSGKVNQAMLSDGIPLEIEEISSERAASHSIDWWLMSEDLPDPNNRVQLRGDAITIHYTDNNTEAYQRLVDRWIEVLKSIDGSSESRYYHKRFPLQWVAHQCGTCRFGTDPSTSVLDPYCRTHEIDNLYVVDGSFFPSNTGSNPTLTIIANALRVGDRLLERLR
jgi:choline dehydrogenase-like flavoprotein